MGHYIKLFVAKLDSTDVFNRDIQDLNPSLSHQSISIYIYIYIYIDLTWESMKFCQVDNV